jgi:hypothetical protein
VIVHWLDDATPKRRVRTLHSWQLLALGAAWVGGWQALAGGPVRALLVLPVAVLLPGWAALAALGGRHRDVDPVAGFLGCAVAGLAVHVLAGFALDLAGVGLQRSAQLLAAGVLTLGCAGVAHLRHGGLSLSLELDVEQRQLVRGLVLACGAVLVGVLVLTGVAQHLRAPAADPFVQASFGDAVTATPGPLVADLGAVVDLPLALEASGDAAAAYDVTTTLDGVDVDQQVAPLVDGAWHGATQVHAPAGGCLHRVVVTFTPRAGGAPAQDLVAYVATRDQGICP